MSNLLSRIELTLFASGAITLACAIGLGGRLYAQTLPPRTALPVVNDIDSRVLIATQNAFVSLQGKPKAQPPPDASSSATVPGGQDTNSVVVLCSTDTNGTPEAMFLIGNTLAFGTPRAWIAGYRIRSINDGSVTMYDGNVLYQSQCGNDATTSTGVVVPPSATQPTFSQSAPDNGAKVPNPIPDSQPPTHRSTPASATGSHDLNTVYGEPAPTSAPYLYPPNPRSTP